jgi:CRP-like cAMP-binding protein
METTMYDNLLQLPLFQGMSKDEFTSIIERVKLHFVTIKAGETIARQGQPGNQLIYLLSGEIIAHTKDENNLYAISETFGETHVIEPYSLFGMRPYYTATYYAKKEAKLLCIDKSFIFSELINYEIFRINYFNILSNRCQSTHQKLWDTYPSTLKGKFIGFLQERCQKASGEKALHITMEDLGNLIDETRINVSRMLNDLHEKGIIQLKRKEIYIPELEKLIQETA